MSKPIDQKTQEEWMEKYEAEMLKDYGLKILEKVKLELATRVDNDHIGSQMGGNPAQFLFVISKAFDFQKSPDGEPHFVDGKPGQIIFQLQQPVTIKAARKALNSFFDSHPDRNDFTTEQVSNPSFLKDHFTYPNINVKLLVKALEIGRELASLLDQKGEVMEVIGKSFSKEIRGLQIACLRDLGFSTDLITDDLKDRVSEKLQSVCRKHPVWGARIAKVNKRHAKIDHMMLSQEDLDKLNTMGSFPNYIAMFSVRTTIQIDRLVKFNLDERTTFLDEINKIVDSTDENDSSSDDLEDEAD